MTEGDEDPQMLIYHAAQAPVNPKAREIAGWGSIIFGGLTLLWGFCMGFSALFVTALFMTGSVPNPTSMPMPSGTVYLLGALMAGMCLAILAAGTAYLVGGMYIRGGSRKWVTALFVLAICEESLLILYLIFAAFMILREPITLVSWGFQFLHAAALGVLIWMLNGARRKGA